MTEDGLPEHLGIPVNRDGEGPLDKGDPSFVGFQCWCGDEWCERFMKNGDEARETFDVKDRLILFTYDSHWTSNTVQQFLESLQPTSEKLHEAGAIAVLVLSSDVTLKTLDERLLTELGLQRIP